MTADKSAVVLVNLGTPDEPTAPAIQRYLKEFLSDPRVVDLPRWLWLPILNLIILRVRPPKLVEKYAMIWGRFDGPIRSITAALASRLATRLNRSNCVVESAMTYGQPSVQTVVDRLKGEGVSRITFIPLYPQYAGATVGAVMDKVDEAMLGHPDIQFDVVTDYYRQPGYISAVADSIRNHYTYLHKSPLVLFSFHGIPKAQSDRGDPYREQCEETAAAIAQALGIDDHKWRLTFQSRFGPAEWLRPYTDETMEALPGEGHRSVLVVCPGFSVDCLETIEEIKEQNQEIFLEAGGETFGYVKALNASWAHADVMAAVAEAAEGQ